MNNALALRPVTTRIAVRCHRATAAARRLAWKLVIEAAPSINLYWCVGLPPYGDR